jgi:hypothetical protein
LREYIGLGHFDAHRVYPDEVVCEEASERLHVTSGKGITNFAFQTGNRLLLRRHVNSWDCRDAIPRRTAGNVARTATGIREKS